MKLTPISLDAPAVLSQALEQRGLSFVHAEAMVRGQGMAAFLIDDMDGDDIARIVDAANTMKVDVVSGDSWVFLTGSVSRLSPMFRRSVGLLPQDITDAACRLLTGIAQPASELVTARGVLDLSRPLVCGIVNITPDSFSDGGQYFNTDDALRHADRLIADGAGMLDVGAESTRPGAEERLDPSEEWKRLSEFLPAIVEKYPRIPISVDTVNAATADRALDSGAWLVNDVSGARLDPEMAPVCADHGAGMILMHSRGEFAELASYDHAVYDDLLGEVTSELLAAVDMVVGQGVGAHSVAIDPGLGFGKTPQQNFSLLAATRSFVGSGLPVMVGPSRKRFLGSVTGRGPDDRDVETASACTIAAVRGAHILRVHDVAGVVRAIAVARATLES